MFPSSLAVILTGLLLCGVALALFVWCWRRGQFTDLSAQSRVIFTPDDLQTERPWESERQRAERRLLHGALRPSRPGQWGGAE